MAMHQQSQAPCLCSPDPRVGPTDEQELFLRSQGAVLWARCQWTGSLTLHPSVAVCLAMLWWSPMMALSSCTEGLLLCGACYVYSTFEFMSST